MRRSVLGLDRVDLLMIAACGLAFTAAIASHGHRGPPPGPPDERAIQQMADELGVTADQLRRATEIVPPPIRGMRPSPEQRDTARTTFAAVLNVPVERLDAVMRHRHSHRH